MATAQKDFQHQVSNMAEHAKDVASETAGKAKDIGSNVAQKAGEAASFVGKKADEATNAVGAGMKNLAGTIRDKAPDKGVVGAAGSAVADTLESSGRYLQQHGLSGISEDLTNMIRRNPIPAVLLSVGVGFLIARATTRS
jgi:hypothetical protein